MLVEYEVVRFDLLNRTFESLKNAIVLEEIINIYINGDFYASFHCLPTQLKELIVGHLLTEGIIEDVKNIVGIEVSGKNIYVKLHGNTPSAPREQRLITTFCSGSKIQQHLLEKIHKMRPSKAKFFVEVVFRAVEALDSFSSVYRASRGSHGAVLVNEDGNVISFSEDVGRHNAIDKVIGDAALKGVDLTRLLLASTGRLTSEIVVKAAQVGIPVLASLAAPTSLGINIANNLGLTLIGLIGRRYFNIYTFPERIESGR